MGIQDRDYYRQDYAEKNGMRYDPQRSVYMPRMFRRRSGPPDGSGAPSGWIKQVVVWVGLLGVVFFAFKFIEQRKYVVLLERQMAAQQQVIQQQKRELEAFRKEGGPRPRVDFFK